jgi:hypothetical protein
MLLIKAICIGFLSVFGQKLDMSQLQLGKSVTHQNSFYTGYSSKKRDCSAQKNADGQPTYATWLGILDSIYFP